MSDSPEYFYLIHPFRDGFCEQPTPEEKAVRDMHFDYLKLTASQPGVRLPPPATQEEKT